MKRLAIEVNNKHESIAVQKALLDMGFFYANFEGLFAVNSPYEFTIPARIVAWIREDGEKLFCSNGLKDFFSYCIEGKIIHDDLHIIPSSVFYKEYSGCISAFSDYEEKPKFKVGDILWCIKRESAGIVPYKIIIRPINAKFFIMESLVRYLEMKERCYLDNIDKEDFYMEWYSTPQLVAKRFLELQKCKDNEK